MSFDAKTGHFILTISEAILAFRIENQDTKAIAARLQENGIRVYDVCPAWVRCDMRPRAVWKVFHDTTPDPSYLASYWTRAAETLHPDWAAEEVSGNEQKSFVDTVSIC